MPFGHIGGIETLNQVHLGSEMLISDCKRLQ